MKRLWIGTGVLTVLLVLGIAINIFMNTVHIPIGEQLQQAAQAAMAENWPEAQRLSSQARERWKTRQHWVAAFADHTPMDEMEGLFAEMEVYAQYEETQHFAAICAHLAQLSEAMCQSHSIFWWNLL